MKTPSLPSFIFRKGESKSRRGVSPVIATTIILAITIVLGLTLWGFANSGVGTATTQYSEAVTEYGEIVRNHRFAIANMDFDNPTNNRIAFWIFNNGKIDTTIGNNTIILVCKEDGCVKPSVDPSSLCQHDPSDPNNLSKCLEIDGSPNQMVSAGQLSKFSIATSGLEDGKTYEISVVSDAGLTHTYVKGNE